MKRFLVMLLFAACKRDESTATAPTETTTSTVTASATVAATTPTPTPTTTSSVTVLRTPLPRAKDVLPPGEVSGDSLVVTGDGYRFSRSRRDWRATIVRSASSTAARTPA